MSRSRQSNPDRIAAVLERRRSNAAGPHANRRRPRGGRSGLKVAIKKGKVQE